MTIEEKLSEWCEPGDNVRSVTEYENWCWDVLPKKLERLLRSVDERAFGAGMWHSHAIPESIASERILKVLEETET